MTRVSRVINSRESGKKTKQKPEGIVYKVHNKLTHTDGHVIVSLQLLAIL